jgi:hypothetical protein
MCNTTRRRLRIESAIWWGLLLIVGGVLLLTILAASGCAATSKITPATSTATRTTETIGARRELIVRGFPLPKEGGK